MTDDGGDGDLCCRANEHSIRMEGDGRVVRLKLKELQWTLIAPPQEEAVGGGGRSAATAAAARLESSSDDEPI